MNNVSNDLENFALLPQPILRQCYITETPPDVSIGEDKPALRCVWKSVDFKCDQISDINLLPDKKKYCYKDEHDVYIKNLR